MLQNQISHFPSSKVKVKAQTTFQSGRIFWSRFFYRHFDLFNITFTSTLIIFVFVIKIENLSLENISESLLAIYITISCISIINKSIVKKKIIKNDLSLMQLENRSYKLLFTLNLESIINQFKSYNPIQYISLEYFLNEIDNIMIIFSSFVNLSFAELLSIG